ncbi:MAG: type II secretion system protein GspE, partial [Alcaligenes aquatilis]
FLLASTLRGVLAQRLIRKLCRHCRQPAEQGQYRASPEGCQQCAHTGYQGRTGIHELYRIDERAQHLLNDAGAEPALRQAARESGMRSLREDAQRWVEQGVSTPEEVLRVTREL